MDSRIAQFVDSYDSTSRSQADEVTENDVDSAGMQGDDASTPWEDFCAVADAWARHADAMNGFGSF